MRLHPSWAPICAALSPWGDQPLHLIGAHDHLGTAPDAAFFPRSRKAGDNPAFVMGFS
jgi:hypothetical protein